MDWKNKLESAKGALGQDAQKKIEENWPQIQKLFEEKVGPAALAAANDDAKVTSAAKMVHEALPFPIRMVVKQDAFVAFCLAHRDRLIRPEGTPGQSAASQG